MQPYSRKEPAFALCGLNCCLCPRHHTNGPSRCPGCGGPEFSDKHPTCAVVTCAKKHGDFEFCFECPEYPCKRYAAASPVDSFISYAKVIDNFGAAERDLPAYLEELRRRHASLLELLRDYDDGRSKGFYCLAMNNLPLGEIEAVLRDLKADASLKGADPKLRAKAAAERLKEGAARSGVGLTLRK